MTVQDQVCRVLRGGGRSVVVADNVLPRIGTLDPRSARQAIRDVFITHVIGGKDLSKRVDLATLVRAATPDAVLSGVELLADGHGRVEGVGDVVVVDVGGATTDVYSVTSPEPDDEHSGREAVATMWRSRTVEGDLGVRWNAPGIVEAALSDRLVTGEAASELMHHARVRQEDPGWLPGSASARGIDRTLAQLASTVALRRHAKPHTAGDVRYGGKDLRRVTLVVGSGGVLRHSQAQDALDVVRTAVTDPAGGWRTPERARFVVDSQYVLAAAGLIVGRAPDVAAMLLRRSLQNR